MILFNNDYGGTIWCYYSTNYDDRFLFYTKRRGRRGPLPQQYILTGCQNNGLRSVFQLIIANYFQCYVPTNTPQFYVPTNVVFRIVTATSIEILNFIGVFPIARMPG